ncbi:1-acyl-sn-glycerol-3-phosphate acyltransferase [Jeongeupia sp. HS-3]|uniref:lysophospholipid acyltransferase family protein n=1 Tax=Jeongeupia sp. HS-3 TaxID=1009682 RepID=UPI0018A63F03|nr:lysophospholipid acyltransferase family protein [Jeongeupia sp. HS-3]BCL77395.1 1-acyl-sn-glycerol-3-phosphate acyltransferase [Jeongeupia sp. HS-3]
MDLNRLWRIAATGFCFAVFGLGGIVILCLLLPLLQLVPGRTRRLHCAKGAIHWGFRFFVALMACVGVISYEVRGAEKLQRFGLFVLANHPSLIDVVILMSLIRRPDCVVKSALWRNPFTYGPVRFAGFISNANGPALIDDCIASVTAGNNLIVFPEGTRSVPGQPLKLQRGAANIAVRGPLPITPVIIAVSEPMLTKGSKWYRVPQRKPHFTLTVLDDIHPERLFSDEPALAARRLTDWLAQFFSQR